MENKFSILSLLAGATALLIIGSFLFVFSAVFIEIFNLKLFGREIEKTLFMAMMGCFLLTGSAFGLTIVLGINDINKHLNRLCRNKETEKIFNS